MKSKHIFYIIVPISEIEVKIFSTKKDQIRQSGLLNKTQFMAVATYIDSEMSNPKK